MFTFCVGFVFLLSFEQNIFLRFSSIQKTIAPDWQPRTCTAFGKQTYTQDTQGERFAGRQQLLRSLDPAPMRVCCSEGRTSRPQERKEVRAAGTDAGARTEPRTEVETGMETGTEKRGGGGSSHSFWTSSSLDVPVGVTQEEGHTGSFITLLSAVRALIFLAGRIQPFLSLVDREVEFCVLTI